MIKEELIRTSYLLGEEATLKLAEKRVAVFGVGGVGGYVAEALARSGVGSIDLFDNDVVSVSNINRQIVALHSTVGRYKVDVMEERMKDINPDIKVYKHKMFFLPENSDTIDFTAFDYVVDAVDTVTAKLEIITKSKATGVPVISAMGAGNRLDPTAFVVTDIYKTERCPLAKVMRRELRKRGVESLKVVYSEEEAIKPVYPVCHNVDAYDSGGMKPHEEDMMCENTASVNDEICDKTASEKNEKSDNVSGEKSTMTRKDKYPPGSIAFVPSVSGLIIAGEVIKGLC